jgi:threonine/homoserine/homoserine lactone efflux protein
VALARSFDRQVERQPAALAVRDWTYRTRLAGPTLLKSGPPAAWENRLVAAMLVTFVLVSAVLTLIPGPDLMFVVRTSGHGRGPAVGAALGAAASALVWGAAAAFGVAALLERSAEAFEVVKLAGAAYLVFLGLRTLWQSRKTRGIRPPAGDSPPVVSVRRAFGLGAGIDLLNPKTGLFYIAVLPQVIPRGAPVLRSTLLFAGVDSLVAAALFTAVACAAATLLAWLRRPGLVRSLERATGLCMVGLGIRTAVERA